MFGAPTIVPQVGRRIAMVTPVHLVLPTGGSLLPSSMHYPRDDPNCRLEVPLLYPNRYPPPVNINQTSVDFWRPQSSTCVLLHKPGHHKTPFVFGDDHVIGPGLVHCLCVSPLASTHDDLGIGVN